MPQTEFMYRLRVRDPNNSDNFVDILVAGAAALQDPKNSTQEYGLVFNNSETGSRFGHTYTVKNPSDESQTLDVERPDALVITDPKDSSQDTGLVFRNNDPPPRGKDWQEGDPSHYAVRVVRYCKDNDPNAATWIDSEWIDAFAISDPKSNAQDRGYVMRWPTVGDPINDPTDPFNPVFCSVDPTLPLDDRQPATINPPWRTDPLQNIVNVKWGGSYFIVTTDGKDTDGNSYHVMTDANVILYSGPGPFPASDPLFRGLYFCAIDNQINAFVGVQGGADGASTANAVYKYSGAKPDPSATPPVPDRGTLLWSALSLGTDPIADGKLIAMCCDQNGDLYVTLGFADFVDNIFSGALIKLDGKTGAEIWRKSDLSDSAFVAVDADKNVIVTGPTPLGGLGFGSDPFMRKYDTNGTSLWTVTPPYNALCITTDVATIPGSDPGYIPRNILIGGNDGSSSLVSKFTKDGALLWTHPIGVIPSGIDAAPTGEFFISSLSNEGAPFRGFDKDANELWTSDRGVHSGNTILIGDYTFHSSVFGVAALSKNQAVFIAQENIVETTYTVSETVIIVDPFDGHLSEETVETTYSHIERDELTDSFDATGALKWSYLNHHEIDDDQTTIGTRHLTGIARTPR